MRPGAGKRSPTPACPGAALPKARMESSWPTEFWVFDAPPPVIEDCDDGIGMTLSLWLQESGADQGWSTITWWTEIAAMNEVAMERGRIPREAITAVASATFLCRRPRTPVSARRASPLLGHRGFVRARSWEAEGRRLRFRRSRRGRLSELQCASFSKGSEETKFAGG